MADLHQLPEAPERTEAQNQLIEQAAALVADSDEGSELVGYVIIGMYADGSERSASFRPQLPALREGPARYLGRSLFHAWAQKALESTMAYGEACDAVNDSWERNGYTVVDPDTDDDPPPAA